MRDLKFRAWDKNNNPINDDDSTFLAIDLTGGLISVQTDSCENPSRDIEYAIVEQFTGLTDKNGKEIYEGDIVRILYTDWPSKMDSDSRTLEQYLIDISHIGKVVFKDLEFKIAFWGEKFQEWVDGSLFYGEHGSIQIIGNIHQTPKLLKHEKAI